MIAAGDWNAQQYLEFERERTRPVVDLLNAVPLERVRAAADVGCGPGNSTEVLAQRAPHARLVGVDSSENMIAEARRRLPRARFEVAQIAGWSDPGPYDLILANAVLQWVPRHERVLPELLGKLGPGGSLAVQMPDNLSEPAHQLMRDIGTSGPWAARVAAAGRAPQPPADWYYRLLAPRCARVEIWRTVYFHPLARGADDIVDWFKGSALKAYLSPLDCDEREVFLDRYRSAVSRAYPAMPDGTVLLPFPRLFIVAMR